MIRIKYRDGTTGKIPTNQLERMIRDEQILCFKRASGWVEVGAEPMREKESDIFCVPERRADLAYRLLMADIDQGSGQNRKPHKGQPPVSGIDPEPNKSHPV